MNAHPKAMMAVQMVNLNSAENFTDYFQKYRDQRENRLNYRGPAATSDK
jgi:hypothetical protein